MSAGQRKETKMAVEFTNAQRTAIDVRGRTMLVSAAAGSGKTATLTERIIRELTDPEAPAEISDMLIVTFTRAAAGELRARIGAALSDALVTWIISYGDKIRVVSPKELIDMTVLRAEEVLKIYSCGEKK